MKAIVLPKYRSFPSPESLSPIETDDYIPFCLICAREVKLSKSTGGLPFAATVSGSAKPVTSEGGLRSDRVVLVTSLCDTLKQGPSVV